MNFVDIYAFSEIRIEKNLHTNVCGLPKFVISFTGHSRAISAR